MGGVDENLSADRGKVAVMTAEQMAEHLQRVSGLLMSLVADAAQLGLTAVVHDLEAARTSVGNAIRLIEPPAPGITPDPLGFAERLGRDMGRIRRGLH